MRRAPLLLVAMLTAVALLAPLVAPYAPAERFPDHLMAPPMPVRVDGGGLYTRPLVLVDRLEQRFETDAARRLPMPWAQATHADPVFLLGADGLGRDVLSRVLHGARASLGLALLATLGALVVGGTLGAWAGLAGGRIDSLIVKTGDVLLVLPALYAVVALRAALPLVLPLGTVVGVLAAIFVALAWPRVARGVRAIVRAEASQDHVVAARALGATPWRVLSRHVLPAAAGFLAVQTALLVPSFVLAESTLSYVGLGFPDDVPSWGTALGEAASVAALTRAPWTLAPAVAIFLVVLVTNLLLEPPADDPASRIG